MSRNRLVADIRAHLSETGPVDTTETSKSWVFLTTDRVFKLKKGLRDDLQDLTPLRARHDNSLMEIDLNRRLAPEVYIGPVAVGRLWNGGLAFDSPEAETVDWLIEMHRLPDAVMLDRLIAGGAPRSALSPRLETVAGQLAEFYRAAEPTRLNTRELLSVEESQLDLAREILLHPLFAQHHARCESIFERIISLWQDFHELLEERVEVCAVVEGHGDLRPEHICLTETPVVYDCLEFNRNLRLRDPYCELTQLGLECAVLGADWIGPYLVEAMEPELGPKPDKRLLYLYEALHAVKRARLCLAHLLQLAPRTPEKWLPLGLWYLTAASRRLDRAQSDEEAVA